MIRWSQTTGVEVGLLLCGTVALARLIAWIGRRVARRIGAEYAPDGDLALGEAVKYRVVLVQVITWTLVVVVHVTAAILLVDAVGVSLTAFVPVATVVGVAVGFGAQRIAQDVVAGFFLIAERQYGFGDLVRVGVIGLGAPILGTVQDVNLRTTTVRTPTGEVVTTPNGQIAQVANLSRDWARAVINVPIPASVDVNRALALLRGISDAAYRDSELRPLLLDQPAVMGLETLKADQFTVRVVARTLPGRQFDVSRKFRVMIAAGLVTSGIDTQPPRPGSLAPSEQRIGGETSTQARIERPGEVELVPQPAVDGRDRREPGSRSMETVGDPVELRGGGGQVDEHL
jgi:small conductance mechanosensitive channel